uniref:Rod shape-determining protein MreD n=1 Tax=Angiostrongylus cantonensis TaxID=6313 RepID=A0A0K0CZ07_ANGCA
MTVLDPDIGLLLAVLPGGNVGLPLSLGGLAGGMIPPTVWRNLWRFPFLVFRHGGIAFFVPYLVVLIIAALPMFFMELVLGQFSSLAAISVWNVVPLFKGTLLMLLHFLSFLKH